MSLVNATLLTVSVMVYCVTDDKVSDDCDISDSVSSDSDFVDNVI